jgi:DAK2 domain fusion protein YloV
VTDLELVRTLVRSALDNLERHRRRINALNVYPVPDGDTGTNLALTVRAIVDALDRSAASTAGELATEVQRAATMEAKGNSGVILSTIVRGMASVLAETKRVDGEALAEALRAGATSAYRTVKAPVEGTMLTVIREMAEEAEKPDVRALPIEDGLERVIARGDDAVARTPEMLDKLREAGVVDAGGVGIVELARGVRHGLTGVPLPDPPDVMEELTDEAIHQEESRYRYCTGFVVEGDALDLDALYAELEAVGDSLLVTGDASIAKVHVHTDEPERAVAIGRGVGLVDDTHIEVADMRSQAAERERWLSQLQAAAQAPPAGVALVAVAQGAGNRDILRSEGVAVVIEGGQTLNPSVGQILEAVTAVNSEHVIVLPNNPNVRLAAENAAGESTKDVRVIGTSSVPEGVAGAFAFDPEKDVDENEQAMRAAIDAVETAEITRASRDATVDGVTAAAGDFIALVDGRALAADPDLWVVVDAVLDRFARDGRSYVQVLSGEDAPAAEEVEARLASRRLDGDVTAGGQPLYPLLLSAE